MTEELLEGYTTGQDSESLVYTGVSAAQTFTIGTTGRNIRARLTKITINAFRIGSPGTIQVKVTPTDSTGKPIPQTISVGTFDGNALATSVSGQDVEIEMQPVVLQKNTKYAIILEGTGINFFNALAWKNDESAPAYSGGYSYFSLITFQSGAWTTLSNSANMFSVYGEAVKKGMGTPFGGNLMRARREGRELC